MNTTKTLDFATRVLIDPCYHEFNTVEKGLAWITTVITAIFTIGTAQIFSVLWRYLRQVEENDTHRMISALFYEIFGMKKEGIENVPAAQLNNTTITPVNGQEIINSGIAVLTTTLPTSTQNDSIILPEPVSLVKTTGQERGRNISFGNFTNEDKEIPSDVIHKMFCHFTTKELGILSQISTGTSQEIASIAKQKIQDTIISAYLIDSEIKKLTKDVFSLIGTNEKIAGYTDKEPLCSTFFKFDVVKWKEVLKDLENALQTGTTVTNSPFLVKECELDLIEALAEYNVRRHHILHDQDVYKTVNLSTEEFERRFLDLLLNDNNLKTFSPADVRIINAARGTCKVSLHLNNIPPNERARVSDCFPIIKNQSINGPYFRTHFDGCECKEGKIPEYRVSGNWTYINIDWLIGKKQGDRFILNSKEYFIIRLIQPGNTIEKNIIDLVCSSWSNIVHDSQSNNANKIVNIDRYKSLFQQLEDAYGKELLERKIKEAKIDDPRDSIK